MARVPEYSRIEVVDEAVAAVLRMKTPADRVAMIEDANRFARSLIAGHLKTQHPNWSIDQIRSEVARRIAHDSE